MDMRQWLPALGTMIQVASPGEHLLCLMTHVWKARDCLEATANSSTVQYASASFKALLNIAILQSVPLLMSTITSGEGQT